MATYDLGSLVRAAVPVTDLAGNPVDPTTITLTVREPDGTLTTYSDQSVPPVLRDGPGAYHIDLTPTQTGRHLLVWETTGPGQGVGTDGFNVVDPYTPRPVTVQDAKTHLGLTGTQHDEEVEGLLLTAERVIEQMVGPLTVTTVTETHADPYGLPLILRRTPALAVTSVTVAGSPVDLTGLTFHPDAGLLHGVTGPATVVYTAGREAVSENIRRAILRYVQWSWFRSHGGSESYLTGGDAALSGPGVTGIDMELRQLLAHDVRHRMGIA